MSIRGGLAVATVGGGGYDDAARRFIFREVFTVATVDSDPDLRLASLAVRLGHVGLEWYEAAVLEVRRRRSAVDEATLVEMLDEVLEPEAMESLAAAAAGAAPPVARLGRHRVLAEVGRGGMGTILRALDPDLRRTVAIKTLHGAPDAEGDVLGRFLQEARLTAQLEHPNIVPVHEIGMSDDGAFYFSMKLVDGRPLDQILEEDPPRSRLLTDFLKIADAVAFAHSHGVVHRDLKPANIMVGRFGEVLVMDWGLARVLGEGDAGPSSPDSVADELDSSAEATLDGTVLGTPAYMPPEQALGKVDAIDARSDVYSLGAILYQMLTGSAPFTGSDVWKIVRRVGRGQLERPSERAPERDIPHDLESVVLRAMSRRREDRYPDVPSLKADVEAFLAGRALSVARYGVVERAARWLSRHRVPVTVAATVAGLALVAGVAARTVAVRREASSLAAERRAVDLPDDLDPATFRTPSGEPRRADLDRLYAEASLAVDLDDRLERAAGVGSGLDGPAIARRRQALCLELARLAVAVGDHALARTWIDRARFPAAGRAQHLAAIDAAARAESEDRVALARTLVGRIDRPLRVDHFDQSVAELVRIGSPDVVRALLDGPFLDGGSAGQRRLVVEALGRIGDDRTVGADGEDAVDRLTTVFLGLDVRRRIDDAVRVGRALCRLGDPRPYEVLLDAYIAHRDTTFAVIAPYLCYFARPERYAVDRPGSVEERLRTAEVLALHEGVGPAIEVLDRVLAERPGHRPALLRRGELLLRRGRLAEGRVDLERALELDGADAVALSLLSELEILAGDPEAAIAAADRALAVDPKHGPAHYQRGTAFFVLERLDEAIRALDRAVACSPSDPEPFLQRGSCFLLKGLLDAAWRDALIALQLDTMNPRAYELRGGVHRRRHELPEAVADYTRALELAPDRWENLENRAETLYVLGDRMGARADVESLLEILPTRGTAWFYRGFLEREDGRLEEALADLERAVEIDPEDVRFRVQRGEVLFLLGRPVEALVDLERVIATRPPEWSSWRSYGEILRALGRREEATRAYTEALARAPEARRAPLEAALAELGR